ncbi:MAG TPA: NIPSNAP family protein [Bryobacteraceae bacterium]|nr:NIPSNAP family protein [Bryobacteraceae bacterium]
MSHVYEMRMYFVTPGKMDALIARFADHTDALFARYGIKTVGYWTPRENPKNLLLYILEHDSVEAAEKNWAAFRADKDWQRIRAETDTPVPLVSSMDCYFMDKIDFSKLKTRVSSKT